MTIEEIFQLATANEQVNELKMRRFIPQPNVGAAMKSLDIHQHGVFDIIRRPDKKVLVTNEANQQKVINTADGTGTYKREAVNRVALALPQLIIERAVSFLFGNPPEYNSTPQNDDEAIVSNAVEKILYDTKSNSINRRIARAMFGFKEVAEMWYPVEAPNSKYGFNSQFKLRCAVYSPAFGDTLYPYFDDSADMIAFSREFSKVDSKQVVTNYFETWTAEAHYLYKAGSGGYNLVDGYPQINAIGKIPVVYGHQKKFETEDVDELIDRLEFLLSNFADTNDYHASPKIFVTGQINGWASKGESGAVIEGEAGSTMNYVSWSNAPESVKLEIETLLKLIYTLTQTPDISWDSVKGLNVSGVALKLLFMDAHLKVQSKREIFDEYLQRRINIILAYISQMNQRLESACNSIQIVPEIIPYMIESDLDNLQYWMMANGNQPLISQEESIARAGISMNPADTMEKIASEQERKNMFNLGEPTL